MITPPPTSTPRTARAMWLTLAAAFLGWMFDGLEMGIFPLVARPALQEMLGVGGDKMVGTWMGYITAAFLIGAAAGGVVFGWLGDKVGRVRAMAWSILVYSGFSGLCYFATEPWHLAGFRFIAALGMGGEWSLGVALVMETWPAKHRPLLAGAIGAASNLGFVVIGLIGYLFPITKESWRWIMLVGAAPAVLTFLIRLFVPESERWKEAAATATKDPLREIFVPPILRHTLIGIMLSSFVLIGTWGSVQWIPIWADQLAGASDPRAKALAAVLTASGAVVGCFFGSLLGRFGRRPAFFLLSFFSLAATAVLFRTVHVYGLAFQIWAFLAGLCTAAFYGWLPLYLPELFPTRVRATAQGVSYNSGRILAAVGALGSGSLVAAYDGSYAKMGATITLIYIVAMIAIWFAPETKDKPLPE